MSDHEYSTLAQTEGGRKVVFWMEQGVELGGAGGGVVQVEITLKSTRALNYYKRQKKCVKFVKFEMIQPVLCFLLDPLTNKYSRV